MKLRLRKKLIVLTENRANVGVKTPLPVCKKCYYIISFKSYSTDLTAQNLAKMAPVSKKNVVFKISVYGMPIPDTYLRYIIEVGQRKSHD